MLGKLAKEGAEVDRVRVLGHWADLILEVVVRVVLPDDFDDDAHSDGKRIAAPQHVLDEDLYAGLGDELPGELIRPNDGLVLGCGVGRDGDDCFQEIARRGLRRRGVLRREVG